MDQDQERDYEEEKYNEALMHDEAGLDEPAPGQPADFDPFAAPEDWLPDGSITQRGEVIGSWERKGSEPATASYRADAYTDREAG
jgi:hypothetical protein